MGILELQDPVEIKEGMVFLGQLEQKEIEAVRRMQAHAYTHIQEYLINSHFRFSHCQWESGATW